MADDSSTNWMPTAGGVLDIISGIFGFIGSLFLFFFGAFFREFMQDYYFEFDYAGIPTAFWWFLGIVVLVLSIMAIVGGIFAVQRKSWGLALAGSICAILQGGILGIIATIFVALSRKEFRS